MSSQSRTFMLTINNPSDPLEKIINIAMEICVYVCGQLETGASGTPHFQLFLYTSKKSTCKPVKTLFPTAHIQIARNPEASRLYCMKEETRTYGPIEVGLYPERGANKNAIKSFDIESDY